MKKAFHVLSDIIWLLLWIVISIGAAGGLLYLINEVIRK